MNVLEHIDRLSKIFSCHCLVKYTIPHGEYSKNALLIFVLFVFFFNQFQFIRAAQNLKWNDSLKKLANKFMIRSKMLYIKICPAVENSVWRNA